MKTKALLLTLLISLLSFPLVSQERGSIIYTDFEPDSIIEKYAECVFWYCEKPENYDTIFNFSIDINYDNVWDFRFYAEHNAKSIMWVNAESNDNWKCANYNDSITDPSLLNYVDETEIYLINLGNEPKINVKGIAFRNLTDKGYCYGWLSYSITSGYPDYNNPKDAYKAIMTLHDMAYCTIPDYPLAFGQKNFDNNVDNQEMPIIKLFPNPVKDVISLQLPENITCEEIKIYAADGRLLKCQDDKLDNINIDFLPKGIHIIKIQLSNGTYYTEKFIKK
ncbi:MAG: T9SS type A sorting domain-containing protein [Bacteroidales bacterium]|nr:T9SS type A sorting domain-containing protein [Bacteroidales bacterium]